MRIDERGRHMRAFAAYGWLGCACWLAACGANEPLANAGAAEQPLGIEDDSSGRGRAAATLLDANGDEVATLNFRSQGDRTYVRVSARLPPELAGTARGLHIHANDDSSNGDGCIADPAQPETTHFVSADGHYNPTSTTHGEHAGDMPALFVTAGGRAYATFLLDHFQVDEVLGRAVILHAAPDNYGNIPVGTEPDEYTPNSPEATELTASTGNAGARYACGVID